jgi:hypothetical protein
MFWTLSIVQYSKKLENTMFRKLDLFPSSGQGGERTPRQLGPFESANLTHCTQLTWCSLPPPPGPEDGNRSGFQNVVFSNFLEC